MQHDLIVYVTSGEWEAQRVRDALQTMRKSPLLGVNRAVTTTKDSNGRVSVLQWRDISRDSDRKGILVLNRFVELTFAEPSPATLDELTTTGLDTEFLSLIAERIQVNSSALFFLLDRDGLEDADELSDALSLFKGRTYKTTLSEVTIATILETTLLTSST